MSKKIVPVLFIASFLVFWGCKKEKQSTKIDTSGITYRDSSAHISGAVDPTDWRVSDKFSSEEAALFPSSTLPMCTGLDSTYHTLAFPNPNDGYFTFVTDVPSGTRIMLRITDANLNVVYKNDTLETSAISLNQLVASGNRDLRLYYRILLNDSCRLQGHGDIAIRP